MDKLYLIGLAIPGILKMHNVVNDVIILRVIHKYFARNLSGNGLLSQDFAILSIQLYKTTRLC